MEDYLLGDSLSSTRWIGASSTVLGLEGQLQGSDMGEPYYIMGPSSCLPDPQIAGRQATVSPPSCTSASAFPMWR